MAFMLEKISPLMENRGTKVMVEVYGGMEPMMFGILVPPQAKVDMLIWKIMVVVFQRFPVQNGSY